MSHHVQNRSNLAISTEPALNQIDRGNIRGKFICMLNFAKILSCVKFPGRGGGVYNKLKGSFKDRQGVSNWCVIRRTCILLVIKLLV